MVASGSLRNLIESFMNESETGLRASLSARVALHVKSQPTSRRSGRARASVVAQRDEIARAVADGWTVKAIWRTLVADGSVAVGYQAFRRQVAELIVTQPRAGATREAAAQGAPSGANLRRLDPTASPTSRDSARPDAARFEHSAAPQKDEIYGR
jgi:hypothetical protein